MNYVIKNTSIYFQLQYLEATYPFFAWRLKTSSDSTTYTTTTARWQSKVCNISAWTPWPPRPRGCKLPPHADRPSLVGRL